MAELDARSERNLIGVHPAMVGVVRRAAELAADLDDGLGFIVTEGLRTRERQFVSMAAALSWAVSDADGGVTCGRRMRPQLPTLSPYRPVECRALSG